MDDFLVAARGRLLALKAAHADGTLNAGRYENQRRAIEREIGDHLLSAEVSARSASPAPRASRKLVIALGAVVVAIAAAGYWKTGSPSLAGIGPTAGGPPTAAAAANAHETAGSSAEGQQQLAVMVDKLAARMKEKPDDAQGWMMLARSYTVLGRFDEAVPAYRRASELQPGNAALLADFADAVATTQNGVGNPETMALVEKSLAIDPNQPKALALAGTAAYDRGDYAGAITRWQKVADQMPPDSEFLKQVQASIAEAREKAAAAPTKNGAAPLATVAAAPAAPAPVSAAASASVASAAGASVSGTVVLDASLQGKASPDDTVFVFARAAVGSRMPLAVKRARVADLPLSFRLDDSMAMAPGMNISSFPQVIVGARVSKSGNAVPQAGDLSGEAAPVAPGATGIRIRIGESVAPR